VRNTTVHEHTEEPWNKKRRAATYRQTPIADHRARTKKLIQDFYLLLNQISSSNSITDELIVISSHQQRQQFTYCRAYIWEASGF